MEQLGLLRGGLEQRSELLDLGFLCSSDGLIWGRPFYGTETFKVYDVLWSTYCPTHYNKTAVAHINGGPGSYNYLQARHVIYP
jgi:hypothetical protein